MADEWYYMHQGRQAGPISLEQLKQLVAAGQLRESDEVWKQGTPDWRLIRTVPELAGASRTGDDAARMALQDRPKTAPPPDSTPAPAQGEATPPSMILDGLVKFAGRSGEYLVLLGDGGLVATPLANGNVSSRSAAFSVPWSEIDSAEQRYGFAFWGIIFHHAPSGERLEVWVLYEHLPPTAFLRIEQAFSARVRFHARPIPIWKIVTLPLVLIGLLMAGGIWFYRSVARAEAVGELGGAPQFIVAFGSAGVVACCSLPVLACLAYAVWLIRRVHRRA